MPPLAHSHLETLIPLKVLDNLSQPTDKGKISSLIENLQPYLRKINVGYDGPTNDDGQAHGVGNGNVHNEGNFVNGVREAKRKITYASGNAYEGHWIDGMKHGKA